MRVNEKMRKALSILLCLCMLLQNAPVMAFAATADNLCEHHTEHTAECGYREGSAGSACTHAHSEDCYAIVSCLHTCGDACANGCVHDACTVEIGCITRSLDCHHVHGNCGYSEGTAEVPCSNADTNPECDHSGDCGYTPATEGTPCTHVCEVKVDSADSCYKLLCSHNDGGHDDACGYAAAVEAHECHYECAECANSDFIANQSADWCGNPLCSQEDAFHVTSCPQYVAPENPQCFCVEKCTEPNVWCDVCGFDVTGCTGKAKPAEGGKMAISSYSGGTVYVHLTLKAVDVSGNEVSTTFNSYIEQDVIDNREGYGTDFYVGDTYCLSGFDIDGYTVKDEEITFTVYSSGNISINSGNASVEYGSDTTYIVIPVNCIGGDRVTIDCSTIDLNVSPYHAWGPGWYADGSVDLHELILTEPYIFILENSESMTKDNVEYIRILGGAILNAGTLTDGVLVYAENGKIQSGTFISQVNVYADGEICGGTFNNVVNKGIVSAGTFNGELTNYGTITNQGNIQLGEDFVLVQNGTVDCNAHIWRDGICRLCSVTCQHSWANGTCTACGTNCDHSGSTHTAVTDKGDGTHGYACTVCGAAVTGEHTGGKATCTTPAVCDDCGTSYGDLLDHNWENGECTYGCSTPHDPHSWKSGTCTVCGLVCTHESFENGTCTLCGIPFMEGYGPDSDDSEFSSPSYVSGTDITSSNPSAGTSWSDETGKGNLIFQWGAGDELDVTAVTSNETVAYEKATVQPHGDDGKNADAHWMQFPLSAAYGEGTPVIAVRGFDNYDSSVDITRGTGSVANVFTQTASGDPGFLSGDMLMYGTTNGTASVEFKHIPAAFRFIITNTHGKALTLESVTLRVVDADGTPVAAASKACNITIDVAYDYPELIYGGESYSTYDAVTTNITGGTLEPGQSYLAYALALPIGKADTGKPDENAFKDKTIQVTVTTSEGACTAFELAADKLAAANPNNDYNWVGGKSYTMRMGTRCADGCTLDAAGKCTVCGYACTHTFTETSNGFCTGCDAYEPAKLVNGVYQISNAGNLYWFAAKVNGGENYTNGILTKDITVNEGTMTAETTNARVWTPIGKNYNKPYRGTFDGNGKTISGLYFNDSTADHVGLFGCVVGVTLKNVGVLDSYFRGKNNVGSVCGESMHASVDGCYSTATVSGNSCVGGVVGFSEYAAISNCYHIGTVISSGSAGGVLGSGDWGGSVNNCYHIGTVRGNSSVGGVVGSFYADIVNNCYYLADTETDSIDGTTFKTETQFTSGEVAYLLQGEYETLFWGQTIGTNDHPVLGGEKVYKVLSCDGESDAYSNTDANKTHTYDENGKCSVCGVQAVTSVTVGGDTAYYLTLDGAIQAVSTCTAGDKAEVKLLENLTLTETITISGGVFTLDLNTKNVVFQTATVGFEISGGEVTFAGNGTVTKDDGTVIVVNTGAVAAIRGGTYDGAVALANYATATVSGGTLKGSGFGIRNTGDLTISNGEVSSYQKNTSNPYDVTAIISSGGRITVTGGTLKAGRFGMLMYQDGTIDLSGFGGAEGVTIWRDDLSTVEMDTSDVKLADGFGLFDENGTQQTGSIEEGTMLTVKQLHVHEWSYAASGDTITATCEGAIGTCPNKTVTIRLKAPENLVYDGTAKTVTVIQSPAGVFADIPAVVYDGDCKNYGTHYANLTYGGETARLGFTIEKATISNVSLDVTAPEAGAAPQNTVAGGTGYSAAIRWNLAAEKFGYNTSYSATVTLTADGNHKFADGITVDGWKVQNTNGILTLTRTFDATRKAKLQSITDAPGNVKLKAYCTEAAGAIAELPGTVTYTAETGSVTVGIQWTCENYNSTTRETNTFAWVVRDGGLDNYDVNSIATSGTITVTNIDTLNVTNTGSNDEITYDGSTYDVSRMFTIDPNAGKAYYSIAGGTGIGSLDGPILTVIKAGTFQIVLYTEANGPYDKGRAIATLTVNKGDFKVTVSIEGWTYGEKPNAPTSNGPGEVTYTYDNETGAYGSTEPPTDAGYWVVLATYTGDDLYKSASAYTRFTIAKKAMIITANDNTITYGDEPEANGVTGNGFAYIESLKDLSGELTYSFDYVRYGDVGAYTITLAGLTSRNYDITFLPGTLTVNPRPATVTANPVSKAYGDTDPALTYAVSGLVNGDRLAGALKRTEGEIPGTYAIGQNTLTAGDNYTLTFKGADFTISKRNVTVTAEDQTIVYGKAISAAAFTAENLVDSHNVTVTLTPSTAKVTANGTITASAAVITADGADVTANYNVSYTSGKLVIAPDTAAIDGLTTENVTSEDEEAIKAVEEMLESADSLTEEWKTLGENCEDLLDRIKEVEAEQKELTDAADAFDEDTVKSTELEELEQLAKEIEDLLDTDNLTEDEREALETVLEQVEGMIDTIEDTAEDSKAATEKIDALDPATVTSDDKDELEQAIETIDELLKDDHLTEDERKALEDAKADAEALIDVIEAAQEATDTENTEKVEDVTADNVKPEDKEALEDAKADLEKALEDNAGNYTEEEKQAIRNEIQRIDDAMVALDNVEDVTDSITQLPETVEPDDEKNAEKIQDAKEAYDDLTDHEKSLVDEDTKKKLDDLVASLTAYDIIKGDGGKWTKGSSSGLIFTANGPFSKFVGIEVDGKEVDEKYYDAKAGSTIITLKSSFLKWRSVGEHTITVLYTDGETTGTFKILAASSSPATGDNSNIMLWFGVLGVSTLGLVVLLADRKRRRSTK